MSKLNSFTLIREAHHGAAKLIASGKTPGEVARLMGASEAQLVRQCADPTFRELVSRYRTTSCAGVYAGVIATYALAA